MSFRFSFVIAIACLTAVATQGTAAVLASARGITERPRLSLEYERRDLLPHRRSDGRSNEKVARACDSGELT